MSETRVVPPFTLSEIHGVIVLTMEAPENKLLDRQLSVALSKNFALMLAETLKEMVRE